MFYCLVYRHVPSVHIFFIDHRNDIVVNIFGLVMSITGDKFVWYLDPIGAIIIALIILFSWASNAFEHVWLLVGKSAPRDFIAKLVYLTMTHDTQITKVDTVRTPGAFGLAASHLLMQFLQCRAYHAGQRYYVEVDIVMDESTPLKISHDVAQTLQRKIEGLADVERAFVHVDYDDEHDIHEEHKPLYEKKQKKEKEKKEKENKAKATLRERFIRARKPTVDINNLE
jgi:divalent metal cation (Fe/Co/Zn/Cd) transporter